LLLGKDLAGGHGKFLEVHDEVVPHKRHGGRGKPKALSDQRLLLRSKLDAKLQTLANALGHANHRVGGDGSKRVSASTRLVVESNLQDLGIISRRRRITSDNRSRESVWGLQMGKKKRGQLGRHGEKRREKKGSEANDLHPRARVYRNGRLFEWCGMEKETIWG